MVGWCTIQRILLWFIMTPWLVVVDVLGCVGTVFVGGLSFRIVYTHTHPSVLFPVGSSCDFCFLYKFLTG